MPSLDQALFGYRDGHRLLASSRALNGDDLSELLPITDLAPGVELDSKGSYWTGIRLPSVPSSYALMRTWSAYEVPRPGCVWTQVLFVDEQLLASIADLSQLWKCFERPRRGDIAQYGEPIRLENNSDSPSPKLRPQVLTRMLSTLYGENEERWLSFGGRNVDAELFRVWTQQWPRFRADFSFRSAVGPAEAGSDLHDDFDLQILIDNRPAAGESVEADAHGVALSTSEGTKAQWLRLALEDALEREGTSFREFLWSYGERLRKRRFAFRALSAVYAALQRARHVEEVLDEVVEQFPNPNVGVVLKRDLVGNQLKGAHLQDQHPAHFICYHFTKSEGSALPLPTQDLVARWDEAPIGIGVRELLQSASLANDQPAWLSARLLDWAAITTSGQTFVSDVRRYPEFAAALAARNPALLESRHIEQLPIKVLLQLLNIANGQRGEAYTRTMRSLLAVDSVELAAHAFATQPKRLVSALSAALGSGSVASPWLDLIRHNRRVFLELHGISRVTSFEGLLSAADLLEFDSYEVMQHGSADWARAMRQNGEKHSAEESLRFAALMFVLAALKPTPGCEVLFEFTFEALHSAESRSSLDGAVRNMLLRYLRPKTILPKWDVCRLMREAVIETYASADLDLNSLPKLTQDRWVVEKLEEAAQSRKLSVPGWESNPEHSWFGF